MGKISTEAWVLCHGGTNGRAGHLVRDTFEFPGPTEQEVLVSPLYGYWEGNMDHAIRRSPVDICALRDEDRIVLGNAGVVRVVQPGKDVQSVKEGDICIIFCNGIPDSYGYPTLILVTMPRIRWVFSRKA